MNAWVYFDKQYVISTTERFAGGQGPAAGGCGGNFRNQPDGVFPLRAWVPDHSGDPSSKIGGLLQGVHRLYPGADQQQQAI